MKRFLLCLVLSTVLPAQVVVTLTGPGTLVAGSTATLTVSVSGAAAANVPAVQWTLGLPSGFTTGTPALASTDPAGSIAACGPLACLVAGSATKLADGNIATIPVTVPLTAKLGAATIPLSGVLAADVNGFNSAAAAGAVYSFAVSPSPCDLTGDGAVTVADVQAMINDTIGTAVCPISSANGGCSVVTVQQVVVATNGGACKVL